MAIAILVAVPGHAQDAPSPPMPPPQQAGWSLTVGAAAAVTPAWQGSRDMSVSLFPNLRLAYSDVLFASVVEGIGWNAINRDGWRAGPLVKVAFGRNEDNGGSPFLISGGSDALIGMGNVKAAAEVGGFVERQFGSGRQWRVRGEVRRGFGGYEGVVADASVNYQARLGRTIASVGPRMTAASSGYTQTYFGIDAGQSSRTGLSRYDADGGIVSYGLGGVVIRPLDRRSVVTLFTGLDRLGAPAGDSPLIRERGRRTQFTLGLGYGFRFGL
ncbi:MAG TPA: MipA/OmpV family protein [Sphingomonas sp.]|nr:MipA/OmpV family protein [Sphingomonas sp.]